MKRLFVRFARNQSAATAVEYALIGALIGVAIVGGALAVGTQLNSMYTGTATKVIEATGG